MAICVYTDKLISYVKMKEGLSKEILISRTLMIS